jgi:hypothetical protein
MVGNYFRICVRDKLEQAVPEISEFYGFDTRAGGTQSLHNAGGSDADRQVQGRWKGRSYKRYSVRTANIQRANQARITAAATLASPPLPSDYVLLPKSSSHSSSSDEVQFRPTTI